ncbi:MAG: xanthine dehydrogenase family protein subunit M [Betaproteobacteria bacterium]|nr:xanthine dehydrogenase family protein subunit M [Betaproteobacteria bacterium]
MRYEKPKNVDEAVALLAAEKGLARVLAGGTDLLVQMRSGRAQPDLMVDCKAIADMTSIVAENGALRFGAATACMVLVEHPEFPAACPGVTDAVKLIGSIQVKGRASVGGNVCNASPAADSVPALIAAGATARISGPRGSRDVPVESLATGPGKTCLARDELVVSFLVPRKQPRSGDAYLRFTPRTEMDIAVVSAGVNLTLDAAGICTQARVSLGAVAERPLLVAEAGAALIGSRIDGAALERLAAAASAACRPIDDKRGTREYRIKVAGVLARRAAQIALDRARPDISPGRPQA